MQGVAFDPLAAVQQPPDQPDRLGNRDAAGIFDRPARTHLVGHRTDPADPRRDVRRLGPPPAAQERLVEPGRFVDAQLHLGHHATGVLDVQGALALDPGERAACITCRGEFGLSTASSRKPLPAVVARIPSEGSARR